MTTTLRLTLYGREQCHLCQDMVAALHITLAGVAFQLQVVDVDQSPELEKRYGQFVPVLMAGEVEICHFHLDRTALDAYLAKIR